MVAVKAHEADAFLRTLPPKITALLFFGSDEGLIAERAQSACTNAAKASNPPGEILRLDDLDLEKEPDRITVELTTVSMFGGRPIVRVNSSRRVTSTTIAPLLNGPPLEGLLVIEAGNLKPDEGLRGLFEKSASAAAIACYADNERDIEGLIRAALLAHKLDITQEARVALAARLGADRGQSRAEIEKLALYCYGKTRIELTDVDAATGDASEQAIDLVIAAAASGQAAMALAASERAMAAGEHPQTLIIGTQRYFQRLHRVRTAFEATGSIDTAIRALRPPLHFKIKDAFTRHVTAWPSAKLLRALGRITVAQRSARSSVIDDALAADRLILDLARLAAAPNPSRSTNTDKNPSKR
jgi:DNA polymerase III subunit delta